MKVPTRILECGATGFMPTLYPPILLKTPPPRGQESPGRQKNVSLPHRQRRQRTELEQRLALAEFAECLVVEEAVVIPNWEIGVRQLLAAFGPELGHRLIVNGRVILPVDST